MKSICAKKKRKKNKGDLMLQIKNLHKSYGNLDIIKGLDLEIADGQVVAVIGPSGSGKSTLLRCINYLELPQQGIIELDGATVDAANHSRADVRTLRGKTSMVFQNYNLFVNKTCLQNVLLPLETVRHINKKDALEQARELLNQVGILDKADSYPAHMSGGQQQRAGIARALAVNPKCILFDEPTSSLDPELVYEVQEEIRSLALEETERIILIVTHEMNFAKEIADRIIYMEDGCIVVDEPAREFFSMETNSLRIKRFLEKVK